MSNSQNAPSDSGSVLIETVIAAAILAMILGTGLAAIGNTLNRSRILEDQQKALLVAQSQLSLFGPSVRANDGRANGVDGILSWEINVEPYTNTKALGNDTALLLITIEVFKENPHQRLVQLRTLRIAGGR
jgi:Tfp pilus assembly protein PilV